MNRVAREVREFVPSDDAEANIALSHILDDSPDIKDCEVLLLDGTLVASTSNDVIEEPTNEPLPRLATLFVKLDYISRGSGSEMYTPLALFFDETLLWYNPRQQG